jgi:predicted nucleic acid-binding protein
MKAFVDTSAWFAAVHVKDRHHERAAELLRGSLDLTTSTFILVETWRLLRSRMGFATAETFTDHVRFGAASIEPTLMSDREHAWRMPSMFGDQSFSLVDRTRFAMMERLAISRAISFDNDFVIYRFGPDRQQAFEVMR